MEGLKQVFELLGSTIHLNTPVEHITMKNSKANGIVEIKSKYFRIM